MIMDKPDIVKRHKIRAIYSSLPLFLKKGIRTIIKKYRLYNWNKADNPVPPPHVIKQSKIINTAQKNNIHILVETGTFLGDMIEATYDKFDQVHSIEIMPFIHDLAKKRFNKYNNVKLHLGDSSVVLKEIVPNLKEPTLFWLDGHFSGGDTGFGDTGCPIYNEIDIIFNSSINHYMLIDDARCFVGAVGYPPLEEFKNYILKQRPNATFIVEDDIIYIN